MEVTRTFDLLDRYINRFGNKEVALAGKKNGTWITYSPREYERLVNEMSYGLLALGISGGDKVATISNNKPEWNFVDMALAQIGAVHVPIYPTISEEEYDYILNHSDSRLLIVSGKTILAKVKNIAEASPAIEGIYSFDELDEVENYKAILELGRQKADEFQNKLQEIKQSIDAYDLVTIIYTSGTTGKPKGVMLSHYSLVTNAIATTKAHYLDHRHRALSFLPLCHVYERMMNYHFQYKGLSIYYAESLGTIAQNIKEVKPHIFNTVPRLLERVYDGIIEKGKNLPATQKAVFFWAVKLGLQYDPYKTNPIYQTRVRLARKLVFSKWREGLGGQIVAIVSGGASLQPRLERIFWAADIRIAQGYGLTETSPVIAVNHIEKPHIKIGTVGKILDGVDAKISDDGEILCKGPNVMMGYYKNPELTDEAIDEEGWFHTGDVGIIDPDGFLKITDRKKEMFKTSSGKYIAPQAIENKLKESPYIEQVMVVGENEKFASALISPSFSVLHKWASRKKISYRENDELVAHEKTQELFQKEIREINKVLGDHEKIKRFRLVCEEWTPARELSPTLKLKRTYLYEKYSELLEAIYGHPHQPHLKNAEQAADAVHKRSARRPKSLNTRALKEKLRKASKKVLSGSGNRPK